MRINLVLPKWMRGASIGLLVSMVFFIGLSLLFENVFMWTFNLSVTLGVAAGAFATVSLKGPSLQNVLIFLGALCIVPIGLAISILIVLLVFTWPTNDRDNANPQTRQEMVEITREWGMLAPFPPTAKDFKIKTEGNMFTRNFVGSFSDSPEVIKAWLDASPGVTKGKIEGETIVLEMGGGANYGTVTVSADGTRVTFRVAWS